MRPKPRHEHARLLLTVVAIIVVSVIGYFVFKMADTTRDELSEHDLTIETLQEGRGEPAKLGDTVVVHYVGRLADGTQFDNSYTREVPFDVTIGEGRVIQGWEKGLLGIKEGERRKLTIPSTMGYGSRGVPNGMGGYIIPPGAILVFEIEALDVEHAAL